MRRLICVWCILAIMSCSTKKDVVHQEYESYHYSADSVKSSSVMSWSKAWIDEMMSEQAMRMSWNKLTIYDTSMPVDENTGRAPILMEYERLDSMTCDFEITKKDSISEINITDMNDSSHVEKDDTSHVYTQEHTERKSTVGRDVLGLAVLIGLVIACIGILLFYKIMDKYGL